MKKNNDSRFEDLESKVSFQDDLLDTLNTLVIEQDKSISVLKKQVSQLYLQMQSLLNSTDVAETNERPPHY